MGGGIRVFKREGKICFLLELKFQKYLRRGTKSSSIKKVVFLNLYTELDCSNLFNDRKVDDEAEHKLVLGGRKH